MALEINPGCRERLYQLLVEKLPEIQVDHGQYLGPGLKQILEQLDEALPRELRDRARDYVGEHPLSLFVLLNIQRTLYGKPSAGGKTGEPITAIESFANATDVATRILDEFENLPNEYIASWKLPGSIAVAFRKSQMALDMGDRLRIESPGLDFGNEYPMSTGNDEIDRFLFEGIVRGKPERSWNQAGSYLFFNFDGYVGPTMHTTPIAETVSLIKTFAGVGIATGIFQYSRLFLPFGGAPERNWLVVHQKIGTCNPLSWIYRLSDEGDKLVAGLRLATMPLDHELDTRLRLFAVPFYAYERSAQIRLACEWLAESYISTSDLFSFIQTTIVLEILLGDQLQLEGVGLTELLATRCSYLIAHSLRERDEIRKDFKDIYAVRSKIVHRGRNQLTTRELSQLWTLRRLAQRVISAEIKLLGTDLAIEDA